MPERWTIDHGGLTLIVKLAPFKHTGVFPEQAEHWRWMTRAAARRRRVGGALEILNLFAYTGGATVALAKAGSQGDARRRLETRARLGARERGGERIGGRRRAMDSG